MIVPLLHCLRNSRFLSERAGGTRRHGHEKEHSGTSYNGLHGDAPPERGTFFRLEVYERVGISRVEVYKKGRENCHLSIMKRAFQNKNPSVLFVFLC